MAALRRSITALASLLACNAFGHDLDNPIPKVLTPVRLEQPRTEVPASVTVLDAALINATGARELAELFRLVPGMAVGSRDGWNQVVSYHGTSYRDSRRMQVLVDGRSVYQAGLAYIDWNDIPLAIEDIERIEIVRGPATSAYGANAFLGVINIITRHPDDSARLRLKATAGTEAVEDYFGSAAGRAGDSLWRVSAQTRRDSGFDHDRGGVNRRDSKNLQLVNGVWSIAPTDAWHLDLRAGYKTGTFTDDLVDPTVVHPALPPVRPMSPPNTSSKDYFVSLQSRHFLSTRGAIEWQLDYARQRETADWAVCLPGSFLGIPAPQPDSMVCGETDDSQANSRGDFDFQYTLLGIAPWQLVSGVHYKQERAVSRTYYGGTVERDSFQFFANFEHRFLPRWAYTVAGSHEKIEGRDDQFSPRLALHFFPQEGHAIRLVHSRAVRNPDLLEEEADWTYFAHHLTPVYNGRDSGTFLERSVAAGGLAEERIRSQEFGYYGLWLNRTLQVDVKWFRDDLEDLISKQLVFGSFTPDNDSWLDQQGFETELDYAIDESWRLRATYALINSDTNQPNEEDLTPHKSGSAGVIWQRGVWQAAAFYYYAYPINSHKFSRGTLRLARTFPVGRHELTISAVVYHAFSDDGELFPDNRYDRPNRGWIAADLRF